MKTTNTVRNRLNSRNNSTSWSINCFCSFLSETRSAIKDALASEKTAKDQQLDDIKSVLFNRSDDKDTAIWNFLDKCNKLILTLLLLSLRTIYVHSFDDVLLSLKFILMCNNILIFIISNILFVWTEKNLIAVITDYFVIVVSAWTHSSLFDIKISWHRHAHYG